MPNDNYIPCFSCGALVPVMEGPIHKYMLSAPGCWHLYGELLAREYTQQNYDPDSHRISVDTYAVSHPGNMGDRRAVQSVNIHLIRMYYQFEKHLQGKRLLQMIKNAAENKELHKSFDWLEPPSFTKSPNITNVLLAKKFSQHKEIVHAWGLSIWTLWKNIHEDLIKSNAHKLII
jgi:hypothetical protein